MIPQQFKQLFGLNSQKDVSMANNIWKMLDEMSQNSPDKYKQFIQKNIKQGVQDVKQKKDEKQKPFKLKPSKGFLLQFHMNLNQKYLSPNQFQTQTQKTKITQKLTQKLNLNSKQWQTVKSKFHNKIHILLNVCYTNRVKLPLNKAKKEIQNVRLDQIKDIQVFYYSLQGPFQTKNKEHNLTQFQYSMIVNQNLYESLMKQAQHGKKMLMSLCISYFQQRIQGDKNILLKVYEPQKYNKLAYYSVQKQSIQISQKTYFYNNSNDVAEFLLQRDVDTKREQQIKQEEEKTLKIMKQKEKQKDIKIKTSFQNSQQLIKKTQNLTINNQKTKEQTNVSVPKKKPLIQVIDEKQLKENDQQQLPYELKQTEDGYHIQILTPGVTDIQSLDLQISDKQIKLKLQKNSKTTVINLNITINPQKIKAKLKKKINRLIIQAPFWNKNK